MAHHVCDSFDEFKELVVNHVNKNGPATYAIKTVSGNCSHEEAILIESQHQAYNNTPGTPAHDVHTESKYHRPGNSYSTLYADANAVVTIYRGFVTAVLHGDLFFNTQMIPELKKRIKNTFPWAKKETDKRYWRTERTNARNRKQLYQRKRTQLRKLRPKKKDGDKKLAAKKSS